MQTLSQFSNDITALVERTAQSVVAIDSGGRHSTSGIHWRAGVIVTADEVLANPDAITVIYADGRKSAARLAGRDPTTDIAVLRVDDTAIPALTHDAPAVRAGSLALAVGRHEQGPIASLGVVGFVAGSWRTRRGGSIDQFIRLELNLARSGEGSAAVDSEGRLIGMAVSGPDSRVLTIPLATIERTVDVLLAKGRIPRGYLGASLQRVRAPEGVLVTAIDPAGPGQRGGLLVGDIITTWNGSVIGGVRELMSLLGPDSVGAKVEIGLLRAGAATKLEVMIGERPVSGDGK